MDDFLHFFDLGIFHDLLYNFLDRNDSGHFDDPFHYFLHYLWHLDDLMAHLEHLQNIINRGISSLLIDHPDHRLVDLRTHTGFFLHLFELSQQRLEEHSKMELDLPLPVVVIAVNILHLDQGGHVFNDLSDLAESIRIHHLQHLSIQQL